jgi:hypothetical protein
MKTYLGSVTVTGADSGSTLVGLGDVNAGLKIKINDNQPVGHGGRVLRPFLLVDAGHGKYSHALKEYENAVIQNVKTFIDNLDEKGCSTCKHIFNMNIMQSIK